MTDWLGVAIAVAGGGALGALYFWGLWLTVRNLPDSRNPVVLTLASLIGRTALVAIGFFLISDARWERLVACLIGFVLARVMLVRRWRPAAEGRARETP